MIMTASKRLFLLWEAILVFYCLSLEVDVNAVSPCINRIELLERLISLEFDRHINATSYIPSYLPSEARTSGIGWCSDDFTCDNTERQFIEVDFGAEVIIEAVAILRAGGRFVTHYNVEYAGSDRDYHCIGEGILNESISNGNGSCNLNMQPYNFTNPVAARFVRVIPIQWVGGASVCLRVELFGCTVKECQTMDIIQPDEIAVSSPPETTDISRVWCASDLGSQTVTLSYDQPVYLPQLRIGSTSDTFSIYQHTNGIRTLYQSIMGFDEFRILSDIPVAAAPLWPPINTTQLEFHLIVSTSALVRVCFVVELIGCLFSNVTDHIEDAAKSSMLVDDIGTCSMPPTSPDAISSVSTSVIIIQSTIFVTVTTELIPTSSESLTSSTSYNAYQSTSFVTTTIEVTASAIVQQSEVSGDCNDNCNIAAIVVPTVLVVIALIVIICVNIVVVKMMNKRRKYITNTTNNNYTTSCIVENDLYQSSQEPAKEAANGGIVSQYSLVDQPADLDSPVVASGDSVPVYSKVEDNREYDYPTRPSLDSDSRPAEYEVVVDTNSTEKTDAYYTVPITSTPTIVVVANPSYEKNHEIVDDTDEQ